MYGTASGGQCRGSCAPGRGSPELVHPGLQLIRAPSSARHLRSVTVSTGSDTRFEPANPTWRFGVAAGDQRPRQGPRRCESSAQEHSGILWVLVDNKLVAEIGNRHLLLMAVNPRIARSTVKQGGGSSCGRQSSTRIGRTAKRSERVLHAETDLIHIKFGKAAPIVPMG